jgi:hypothetical protein
VGSRGGKTQAVDDTLDQMALVAIVQVIPEYVMMVVVEQERTWDALKEMHIGEERVKKAKVQTLKRDFNDMYMGESKKKRVFLEGDHYRYVLLTRKWRRSSLSRSSCVLSPNKFLPMHYEHYQAMGQFDNDVVGGGSYRVLAES